MSHVVAEGTGLPKGPSFAHFSNLRQIEARKRLFETKLKIMDSEAVKFTCLSSQIPSYFMKLDKLSEVERAAKELKAAKTQEADQQSEATGYDEKRAETVLGKRGAPNALAGLETEFG